MLSLTRKPAQSLIIGGVIKVTVVDVRGRCVKLSIDAPADVTVNREEVEARIRNQGEGQCQ